MFKLVLEKAEEPEIKLLTFAGLSKKQESSRKNIYFCFIDYAKAFDFVDHNKLWKILKEMGIRDHLTYLLRNLYANQEATVRTRHGKTDWLGSIPGSGRSPGEGNGNPFHYSCLENLMDGGAWWAAVHRVAKSRARLSN